MRKQEQMSHSEIKIPNWGHAEQDADWHRIMGCWLGKAVGGTLGAPYETMDGPFELTFYDPVPEKMLPNDDLDLQVVWACVLNKLADPQVDRNILAQAWLDHVRFPFSEYAVALRNLNLGIKPPLSGSYDNWFANNMGAAIRSEIWACLAPRNPELAVAYAYEDACVDHANEGVWSERFLAALQSAAFGESDPDVLLDAGLSYLPDDSLVACAVRDTRKWWAEQRDWLVVREQILQDYGQEDSQNVVMNMAFIVLAWLASEGDFSKAICTAVNCGKDTDCTGATVGALMGIIDPSCISDKWLKPIGSELVLSPEIIGLTAPSSLEGFTDLIVNLRQRINGCLPDAQHVEQSTEPFRIKVDAAFTNWQAVESNGKSPALDEVGVREMILPGAMASLNREAFEDEVLLLRYTIHLDASRKVRLMFNTAQKSCVWIDGAHQFGRDGGRMIPSPHRTPENQYIDLLLDEGAHEVIAAVGRPESSKAEWVIAVADATDFLWIPGALLQL